MFFVPIMAGIIVAAVSARRTKKRREAEELKQLQKDEQARRLEAKQRAEEKRRLEEAAWLQEEERTKREQEERERRQAEEIRRRNEEETIRLEMPLFASLSPKLIPSPLLSPLSNWIRETWQHEANDFTPWLAEHLELVSDCTGLELNTI